MRNLKGLRAAPSWAVLAIGGALLVSAAGAETAPLPSAVEVQRVEGAEGIAAYYAKRFEGRRTTSGERYRADKLTAAHPDLPLGTRVKVIHPDSGDHVVVTVNDRCRGKRTPFIDLSRAAAKKLGFLGRGIARVRLVLLAEEESTGTALR